MLGWRVEWQALGVAPPRKGTWASALAPGHHKVAIAALHIICGI